MSKGLKNVPSAQDEAFEIIELAVDDLQTLTKAFNLIAEICEETGVAPSADGLRELERKVH